MWASLLRGAGRLKPMQRLGQPSCAGAPSFSGALTGFVRGMANYGYVTMKRRFKGLYGGKHIGFGNTISFSHRKCAGATRPVIFSSR